MINLLWRGIRKLAIGFLRLIFKILHKDLTKEKEEGFIQFVKFGLVGLSNTVISYVTYVIFLFFFQKAGIFPEVGLSHSSGRCLCHKRSLVLLLEQQIRLQRGGGGEEEYLSCFA